MAFSVKSIIKHLLVLLFFALTSLLYFYPVLQGKALFQSDIAQYGGMAKERNDFKALTGEESYWTNSAFGGMPTYQLGANFPHNYIKQLDRAIRFMPRPTDYLFLYLVGFYVLMLCLKTDYRLAILGALAFGLSTYLIIILEVGHNAKAHALGYIPMVLGGIILVFRKKYFLGFVLTALAMALEINANHFQMTYYFGLLVVILGLVYLIYAIKQKQLKHFGVSVGLLLIAVVLAFATNATSLLSTKEYADWSTRGTSELKLLPNGTPKPSTEGLDKEYITRYSYGIAESLNLFSARLFGGSSAGEDLGKDSKAYEFLVGQGLPSSRALEFSSGLPLYWGKQPGVAAPAYVGAVVFFLFFLGLFLVKSKHKWWLLGGAILSLLLSWGKNFSLLTDFMIDFFPLYDKFRAVSSIQVVLELCIPVLGILGLREIYRRKVKNKELLKGLKWGFAVAIGLGIFILVMKAVFRFEGLNDEVYRNGFGDELMSMIVGDRKSVYVNDTLRSLLFVLLTAVVIWLWIKEKININIAAVGIGLLLVLDLGGVNRRYVNDDDFVRQRRISTPFQKSQIDEMIYQDKGIFRVFDPQEELNGARTSFFHKSIGGYHAAKPKRLQDLFQYQLYQNNIEILDMLNVKYIIQQDEEGNSFPALNDAANGNAWFVQRIIPVNSSDEEINALSDFDSDSEAVINTTLYPRLVKRSFDQDSTAVITLDEYQPNYLKYSTKNTYDGFAVFSEMHYPKGWEVKMDGKPVEHYRVNYALRGLNVPSGEHTIEFAFVPPVVETGSKITLASCILLGLIVLGGAGFSLRKKVQKKDT
ncbi:MAG: YfhO family protein [Bacteroidota bacterium]